MVAAFAVGVISAGLLLAAWFLHARSGLRAALVVVLALSGLAAVAPAQIAAASGSTPQSGARSTLTLARPLAARKAAAPSRELAPAVTTYNPATGSQGYGVFVQGNATLGASSTNGPVAMGGNLTIGSNFTVAAQTAGTFTASGDAHPTGLLVGGSVNWSASNSGGAVNVGSSGYVKVGNMTGSVIPNNGGNPTHVSPTGSTYGSKPQVALNVVQPPASVNQSGLINFTSAFSAFTTQSADMAACANSVTLTSSNGTALGLPLSPGTNAYVTLTPGTQNVLDISAANLSNISTLTFNNSPTSTMPLIINVNTSAGNNFSWTPGNFNGIQSSGVPYMLWNFSTATQVTIAGSSTVPGTIYAPGATVNDNDQNGLNGGVIAAAYAQGGVSGSPNGGQVQYAPFAGTIASCSAPALTVALTSTPSTAVPGGTVRYTVSATNSGSSAYSAATLTDSLSGVIDDATYNGDASASSGSVSYTSPNLTWTGSLAAGAVATITFSVTVSNPDTGDKSLVSTVTSTSTGSNCAAGSTDPRCSSTIGVSVLIMAVTASTPTATPSATVGYTVTVTNSGTVAVSGAALSDSLSGVLDDASYNGDATATAGSVTFTSPNLTWAGSLAAGAVATITFSVTVNNPDTGNRSLASAITSGTAGSNCASGSTDTRCANTVTVQVPGLTIALTASTATPSPGTVVTYTITATNSGQTAYTGAAFTDSLSGLLDDASYNGDATATAGTATYAGPNLAWTGNLAVGAVATITFSVTVKNPDTGDKVLATTVTSATAGSNCAAGSTDSRCASSIPVLVPGLAISASAGSATTTPGATERYTVTVTNTGGTVYTGAAFTDPLGDVLDDASYNGDATATAGTVSFASPNLTWTGNLAVGAVATITFSVTVNNPDTGNKILAGTITSATPGSNCPAGNPAASCTATVNVAVLTIVNSAGASSTTPGSVVRFTATFTNSGQVPYTGITIASNITDVLDDATPNSDETATSGTLSLTATGISWAGSIPVGGTVTVTGTVTVKNPDPGNKVMAGTITTAAPGSNCPSVVPAPAACSVSVPVLIPALTISASANTSTAVPGMTIGYTVTVTNSGQTPYSGATFTDSLAGALDDATYNGNAATTGGSVTYSSPSLTWTGDLAVGATATITFSVTVNAPDTGDKVIVTAITSSTGGSNCPAGGSNPGCSVTVAGLTPALTIAATASSATTTPGAVVSYTVTVTDSGQTPYTGASASVSLAGVLDDAAYDGDAAATTGGVSFTSPSLTWTGNLAVGATATITYSATVNNPDTGDHILASTITSAAAGGNCAAGSTDPRCATAVNVAQLLIIGSTNVSTTTPGGVVRFTGTFTNTGQVAYTGITIASTATDIFDDASPDGDQTATSGTLTVTATGVSWTGNIPVGGSVTITGTVTVHNPDTGDKVMTGTLSTAAAGSNCAAGSSDPRCTTTVGVLTPGLTIVKTANVSTTTPGSVVGYTVTVTDTGQTRYPGAALSDSLSGLLPDAAYNGDAAASVGSVSYAAPALTWTGNLAVGQTATITYSVTVDNPDTGDRTLSNTVTSSTVGSNCQAGGTDPRCSATVQDLVPGLTIAASAASGTATPGSVVHYTVTAVNTGQITDTGVSFTDALAGVLDDAAYNGDAAATAGSVSFASPNLTWRGSLAPGATATVTFSVTVSSPDTGNGILSSTVTSAAAGSNCAAGSTDPRCTSAVTVSQLTIVSTPSAGTVTPGAVVNETTTITNAGQAPYNGISVTFSTANTTAQISDVGNETASSGTLSVGATGAVWTGDVPVGATVTITGSIIVANPYPAGGQVIAITDATTAAGSNCPAGSTDPRCTMTVNVVIPGLTIVKTADTSVAVPGTVVGYTVTVTDSGQTPYTGAVVADDLSGVQDDASYDGDAVASAGSVGYTSPVLTWTGNLAVGQTATFTYSVTVTSPDAGDKLLVNTVSSSAVGSSCPPGMTTASCQLTIPVLTPALTIVASAATTSGSNAVATPGGVVSYTVSVTNTGQAPYSGAAFSESLAGVLDDASYNSDAAATAGTVSYAAPVLSWTGSLSPGAGATITFSVTVNNPDRGDKSLAGTVVSATPGSNCPAGGTDARCSVTVTVVGASTLTFTQTAAASSAVAGGTVHYTVTIANSGASVYAGAAFSDPLGGVLDDATWDGDAAASSGALTFASPTLSWAGDVPAGGTVTITYSVTVNNPDTGNKVLASTISSSSANSNCPAAGPGPRCTATVTVSQLAIDFTVSAATVTPGGSLVYTATLANTGQTPYFGISVDTDTTELSANATSGGAITTSSGTLSVGATGSVWTGDIPVGGTVTITSPVIVGNPVTNSTLTATAVSAAPGSNCPAGSADPRCTPVTTVLTPGLTISQVPNTTAAVPGQSVGFTVTITDSGQTPYAGAVVTDSFADMADDGVYDGNAVASAGSLSYAAPVLTWTGNLLPGASVTITYTVTVDNPDTGDKLLVSALASAATGSSCPPGTPSSPCRVTVPVLTPALTIVKTASTATAVPGQTVTYTVTVTDSGQTPYTRAAFTDSLSGVLGDAAYNNNAAATAGSVSYTAPNLAWTGDLAPGDSATVTYTVTVHNPDAGGHLLTNTVTSPTVGSNCPAGGTDPRCAATVDVSDLTIVNTASTPTTTPGMVVGYTITVTNSGPVALPGGTITAALAPVLDDATYNGDAAATAGNVALASDGQSLTWTGNLSPGATGTITYSVTVNNPDTGDKILTSTVASATPGSSCPASGTAPAACTAVTTVLVPGLTIANAASTSTPVPGAVVTYTLTITDSGQTPYTGATVTDTIAQMLDDAAYNGDAAATAGSASYAAGVITWTGDLAPGGTATVTFTVTVTNADTGDKLLIAAASSAAPGSTCPPGTTTAPCRITTGVLTPALTIISTADASTTVPGAAVGYTITITDTGQTPYTGATITVPLTDVLDDAAYNNDATATTGRVSYTSPVLTWTGSLASGDTATITYAVTISNPDTGNHILASTLTSSSSGSNCPSGGTDPRCTATVAVSQLVIDFTVSAPTVTPGGALIYTAALTNAGQSPYFGISVSTDTIGLAANTTSAGNTTASSGTLSIGATGAVWTGNIPVGGTVTITSSVTVNNPVTSDTLTATAVSTAPGSNCLPGSADPRCTPVTQILTPGLSIVTTANTSAAVPGQTVAYTVTVTDTGQTPYTGATVTETLNLLDDATYNNNAAATSGAVSYASPVIAWTGDLAVGASAVITYTIIVNNPDPGDKTLNTVAASTDAGSSCPPASPNAGCGLTIAVLTPAVTIVKTASPATAVPGQSVTYTVTVTDSGQTPYTGAAFSDSLSGVLADASYNNDAAATSGTVSYASPVITWTGDLAVGATATITYAVTVDNPDTGSHVLANTITSATAGNNCPAASTDPRCTATVDISALTIVNTASVSTTVPGSTVAYTVTITNTGRTPYASVSVTDPLTGVLDDAVFNKDANTTTGSVSYDDPNLVWTGELAAGSSTTITFSVTVNNPDAGDKTLTSTVTSAAAGNNCPAVGTDPSCTATVSVLTPALTITKTATASTTTPGSTVGFTITVTDSGQTPYSGITVTDPLSGVLSDGVYNNDATATAGSVSYASPTLTWTGDLAVGATATITYTVTVNNPDTGDKTLINTVTTSATGSNCPAGGTDRACAATVQVLVPALTITKTATVSSTTPGSTVGYTVTVADTGQTPYAGARVTDSLAGVLGDAAYNGDASASAGTVGYASPTLTWTGDLALGEVATISYSVTVNDPDTGGRLLANIVVSSDPGSNCPVGSTDPSCAVTVPVMAGTLSMSAPISANLGLTGPGGSVSASLGTVQVADNRGFGADWTATVSATGFTTGNGTAPETIPASDALYGITGFVSTTGTANFSVVPETTLSGDPQPVVSATNVGGDTSATWDPLMNVQVPTRAIVGQYTATIVHSVS